jgi:hypothetical protein
MPQSIIASIGFALFILCPRMAGMANVIANATKVNLVLVSVIFRQWGLWAALAFAVLTDVLAALVMGAISWKSSLETFIIALFVIGGVRVASLITAKVF